MRAKRPELAHQIFPRLPNETLSCGVAKCAQVVFNKNLALRRNRLSRVKCGQEAGRVSQAFVNLWVLGVVGTQYQMVFRKQGLVGKTHEFVRSHDGVLHALRRTLRQARDLCALPRIYPQHHFGVPRHQSSKGVRAKSAFAGNAYSGIGQRHTDAGFSATGLQL